MHIGDVYLLSAGQQVVMILDDVPGLAADGRRLPGTDDGPGLRTRDAGRGQLARRPLV